MDRAVSRRQTMTQWLKAKEAAESARRAAKVGNVKSPAPRQDAPKDPRPRRPQDPRRRRNSSTTSSPKVSPTVAGQQRGRDVHNVSSPSRVSPTAVASPGVSPVASTHWPGDSPGLSPLMSSDSSRWALSRHSQDGAYAEAPSASASASVRRGATLDEMAGDLRAVRKKAGWTERHVERLVKSMDGRDKDARLVGVSAAVTKSLGDLPGDVETIKDLLQQQDDTLRAEKAEAVLMVAQSQEELAASKAREQVLRDQLAAEKEDKAQQISAKDEQIADLNRQLGEMAARLAQKGAAAPRKRRKAVATDTSKGADSARRKQDAGGGAAAAAAAPVSRKLGHVFEKVDAYRTDAQRYEATLRNTEGLRYIFYAIWKYGAEDANRMFSAFVREYIDGKAMNRRLKIETFFLGKISQDPKINAANFDSNTFKQQMTQEYQVDATFYNAKTGGLCVGALQYVPA